MEPKLIKTEKSEIKCDGNIEYLCKVLGFWCTGSFLSKPFNEVVFTGYTTDSPLDWISEIYLIK